MADDKMLHLVPGIVTGRRFIDNQMVRYLLCILYAFFQQMKFPMIEISAFYGLFQSFIRDQFVFGVDDHDGRNVQL